MDGLEQPPIEGDYVDLRDLEWKSLQDRRMRRGLGMLLHTQREGNYVGLTQLPGLVQQLTLSSKRVPDGNAFNRGVNDLNYRCQRAQTRKTWKSRSDEASCVRRFDLFTGNSTQEALAPFPGRLGNRARMKGTCIELRTCIELGGKCRRKFRLGDLEMLTG